MAKFIEYYAKMLAKEGLVSFRTEHASPVLIGLGMVGELDDASPLQAGATMFAKASDMSGVMATASLAGRVWFIEKGADRGQPMISVGRSAENDVVIPEYSLSRRHCAFKWELGHLSLIDRGSTNGTALEDEKLSPQKPVRLSGGETVTLGRYQFQFLTHAVFVERLAELSNN
jgi:hypothetical protein